jgi:hypothetical protein
MPGPLRAQTPAVANLTQLRWTISPPRFVPPSPPNDECYSIKDPSIVYADGAWHLFCTIRGRERSHQIEYLRFPDWKSTSRAERRLLTFHSGFFCAPQVFYFRPHGKWYLICQASDDAWQPKYGAAFSTTTNIADPESWSSLKPLRQQLADGKAGLDFWVICDASHAHLFFTTNDGRMWREQTSLADFPHGWSEPRLALQGDIFEASHTYKLKGIDKYLTIIEAQDGAGWRYQKSYLADRLDGPWSPLEATRNESFASLKNTTHADPRWTDSISHGELLRSGSDEMLEVDPSDLRFVFQGVTDAARAGKPYGQIPWRLGLLTPNR